MAYRLLFVLGFIVLGAGTGLGKDLKIDKYACGANSTQNAQKEKTIERVCLGQVKDAKQEFIILEMVDASERVLEVVKSKRTGVSEQEFGDVTNHESLVEVDEELKQLPKKVSKATVCTTWEYSDRNTQVRGQTSDKKSFDAFVDSDRIDEVKGQKSLDTFTCHVSEAGKNMEVKFAVKDMAYKRYALVDLKPVFEGGPISITPKEIKKGVESTLNALNAQGGAIAVGKTRLVLTGDDDGVTLVHFVLFKNSDYKHGYVRVSVDTPPGAKDPSWYGTVICNRISE